MDFLITEEFGKKEYRTKGLWLSKTDDHAFWQ